VQNLSNENEFDLHENEPVGGKRFHMNGFVRTLVLTHTEAQETRKWPMEVSYIYRVLDELSFRAAKVHEN